MKNWILKFVIIVLLFPPTLSFSQKKYTIADIPFDLMENSNSVLIEEKIDIDVSIDGKSIYHEYAARAVLNKKGNEDVNNEVYYNKGTKIKKIEAYVYDIFGNEIDHFRRKDFTDISAVGGGSIYSDTRLLYLNYTPTTYPYIIVIDFERESNTTAYLQEWNPVGWYNRSTKTSTYTIKYSTNNKPRIKTNNLEGFDISISENPNEFICKAKNIKAFVYEEYSLPFNNFAPSVSFSLNRFYLEGVPGYAKNWREFGLWIQNSLLADVGDIPESTIREVNNLIKNETTNESKARIIYKYLQEKVRYVSVQIGIGGWKPMLASDVDKLSYGDCKALTNYTKVLLDAVGVPSYYTILYAGNLEKNIDKDFSRLEGNHVMLGIPDNDEIIWLECTSQDKPFGFIGNSCDDRDVLMVTPEGGEIVHTKKYGFSENLQQTNISININNTGGAQVEFSSKSTGTQYGDKFLRSNDTKDDINKFYKNRWGNLNGYTIEKIKLDNNKEEVIFTEELSLTISKIGTKIGEDLLFCPNVFNQQNYIPPRIKDRKNKLNISQGYVDIDTVLVSAPIGYVFDVLPENKHIENKFGSYSTKFKLISKDKIEYSRHLIIRKGTFPKEDYNEFRSFRRRFTKLDNVKMILIKEN